MTDTPDIRDVHGPSTICTGTAEAPHEARRLDLPLESVVGCPVCGARYRQSAGWVRHTPANWPKADKRE